MALSETRIREYVQRLLLSRMRILCNHGFYGLLLMHMRYGVDENEETAYTDGIRIVFGTEFLDNLSDDELDFVMMHEIMHVVLQHCFRGKGSDDKLFNIACDIVINSTLLKENGGLLSSITLKEYGEAMHLTPDGKEGCDFTAEQVYEMLVSSFGIDTTAGISAPETWDDHSKWGNGGETNAMKDSWAKHLKDAVNSMEIRDPDNSRGSIPMFAKRMLDELGRPQTDWRTILNEFVQEEISDYSFSPPDKRFDGGDFFLPDFNEKDDVVEDVLFMVDTSGSMNTKMITAAFSEIKGAIDQFGGKLRGWLGFFDAEVVDPKPFSNEEEFRVIRPEGGGGTSFGVIFDYVRDKMEKLPASIIILTDGFAPFPTAGRAMGVPVLWMINNEDITPPWGKVARIKV